MTEKNLKLDRSAFLEKNDSKSRTPVNLRYHKGKPDMTPTAQTPVNQQQVQIKAMLKEQILRRNLADPKVSSRTSKTPNKNIPFINKKLNLNLLHTNDSSTSEFQKFFQRDMSNPEIIPLTTKQNNNNVSPNNVSQNKMAKLLKNLIPDQISNKNQGKESNLNFLLASLKRDNSPGRLSQRSSTSELRKNTNKNALTPINSRSRKNGANERSLSPKAPYMSIKDYLQGRDKKKEEMNKNANNDMKTPAKNDRMKKSLKNPLETGTEQTLKKPPPKNEDLKITIKEDVVEKPKNENFQPKQTESQRKKPEFLVNVNINIENNVVKEQRDDDKNNQKVKEEMLKILQQKLPAEPKVEDKEKRKNLIENFKIYDSKLAQLINCQKKPPPTLITSSLNVTQERLNNNTTTPQSFHNNISNVNAKTTNNFFEQPPRKEPSRNPTPNNAEERRISKRNEEEMKTKRNEEEKKTTKKDEDIKSENNKSILSSHSNTSKQENIIMKEQPNIRTLNNVIMLEDTLTNISKCFKENQKIIAHCKNYLNIVAEGNLEFFEVMYENEKHRNSVKEMIILERIVVITVISLSFDKNLNPKYVRNCINLLEYIHQNFIMFIELILEKVNHTSENESLLENLKKILILKKTRDTSRVLKSEIVSKNLNIILKILQNFVKENKFEPFVTISALLEDFQKMSITDSTQYLMQCFYSLIIDLEEKMGGDFDDVYTEQLSQEQLSVVVPPYLPELPADKKNNTYTLVIDLDETLVHYEELEDGSGQFLLRPFSETFLAEMSKYFEVVIFTAALQDYADYILNIMDEKNQFISYRLYRKHTVHNGAIYVKDLSKLGRDLSRVIIIDNLADNFQNQPENGIFIQSWYGEPDDKALYYLAPLLKEIVNKKYDDVRMALQIFKEKMIENINKGSSAPHINLNLD